MENCHVSYISCALGLVLFIDVLVYFPVAYVNLNCKLYIYAHT